ncbi:mitochondrial intermembrane space import and assembly protein 40 isoform X1 [Felis catus]|uniref:CHCH domain-containing protein n=1 Tax=Felis catus TaxID=9685 RepID=A0ABI7XBE4_FELCA|nr:mitochondrial intermembrane space import and assembly protein 40 isoform X1 [Felis catus]
METGLRGPAGDTLFCQPRSPTGPGAPRPHCRGGRREGRPGIPSSGPLGGLGAGVATSVLQMRKPRLGGRRLAQGHGKDRIIFVTKEDHETPSNAELVADDPNDPYEEHGLILPSGDINWNCPCLGGMASGPCGEQFKSAFSCFHYSTEDVKGSDCVDQFRAMQECMQKYPDLYPQEDEEEEEEEKKPAERLEETASTEATATKEEEGSS